MSSISLHANGEIFSEWKEFTFIKTLNAICDYYSATITISTGQNKELPFRLGQECFIKIDGKRKFTGYIETVDFDIDEDQAEFRISGRSKTCDLVDCSIDLETYEFTSITLLKLVTVICSQFGLSVVNKTKENILVSKWNIYPGETAWQCLERLSRKFGILFYCNELGELVIGKEDPIESDIDLSEIMAPKKIKGKSSQADRFSTYKVIGQARTQSEAIAAVSDSTIARKRTKIILAESASTSADCKTRALWEKQISAQRSADLSILIDEWTQGRGKNPWWVNLKTKLIFPYLGINQYYLITGIRFTHSEKKGQQTLLEFEEVKSFTL